MNSTITTAKIPFSNKDLATQQSTCANFRKIALEKLIVSNLNTGIIIVLSQFTGVNFLVRPYQ